MSRHVLRVHHDRDGQSRCGLGAQLTADENAVTCGICLDRLAGIHYPPHGYQQADVKPCGTAAAYRRHLRRQGAPVRCESCLKAEQRRNEDRRLAA